jgi:hypothetical protein
MLQDLPRGRPLEIDVLASSVAEMGSLFGLITPTGHGFRPGAGAASETSANPVTADRWARIAVQQSSGVS